MAPRDRVLRGLHTLLSQTKYRASRDGLDGGEIYRRGIRPQGESTMNVALEGTHFHSHAVVTF